MKSVIAVAQQKGGTGKTTLAMLLAANLSSPSFDVAVVDLDPQASASIWAKSGRFPVETFAADANSLPAVIATQGLRDMLVLDCPPGAACAATLAAVAAANLVLVPCTPSPPDIWATEAVMAVLQRHHPQKPALVVVNQGVQTRLARQVIATMRTRWPTAAAELGQRTAFREAAAQGTSLKQHCRRGAAVQELDALTLEVLAQITRSA